VASPPTGKLCDRDRQEGVLRRETIVKKNYRWTFAGDANGGMTLTETDSSNRKGRKKNFNSLTTCSKSTD
jgi:hypothetical protein